MKLNRVKRKILKPCCFFKLILSPKTQSKKLRIPELFVRTFREELSTTSILTVPTGKTHKVGLVEEDNKLWFHDGWQEFVEDFSVGNAFFLQFKYEGNSQFRVHIFDPTACEISYQCNAHNDLPRHPEENDDSGDKKDNIKILHSTSVNLKNSDKEVIQMDSDDDEKTDDARGGVSFRYPYELRAYERMMNAAVAAGISLPERPFFVTVIKPYSLHRGRYLTVPISFGRDHFRCAEIKSKFVTLEAYGGRQWTVRCMGNRRKCTFGTGWIVFARDVGLEIGDICVFELTDAKSYVLNVHVAKKSQIKVAPGQIFESI